MAEKEDQQVGAEDVIVFCKERINSYKYLKSVDFVNATQKLRGQSIKKVLSHAKLKIY